MIAAPLHGGTLLRSAAARVSAALLAAVGAQGCSAHGHDAAAPTELARGKPSYDLTFAAKPAVAPQEFRKVFSNLATWPYFGGEAEIRAKGQLPNRTTMLRSRTWSGLLDIYVDAEICPSAQTPSVKGGTLRITAYRLSADDQLRCSMLNRPWASAIVTSQPSFSQTYGYWEVEARLPCSPGRWPAFWLLPTSKTPANGGRLAEIDIMEHHGGLRTIMSNGKPFVINRVGQPFSTLHYGEIGAEQKYTNGQSLPNISDEQRLAFCKGWHRFGVDWTKAMFRFYIDGRETLAIPNPGVDDPHYWVVNLDISQSAGDPSLDPAPSEYEIRSIRVWPARPGGR